MNLNDKEATSKMVYYIFHIILLVTLLLIVNSIICYHFVKHGSKQKIMELKTQTFVVTMVLVWWRFPDGVISRTNL